MDFFKAETNGNDFIIIEKNSFVLTDVETLCDRRIGIGADQVIVFQQISPKIFKTNFYNSDGSKATMCGNGLCALTRLIGFENVNFLVGNSSHYSGHISKDGRVSVTVPLPQELICNKDYKIIDVGNKHIVCIKEINLEFLEKNISNFNIHFITAEKKGFRIVTYERGVGRTLACGSGAIAVAYAYGNLDGPTCIYHEGGTSIVSFRSVVAILTTKPRIVFEGKFKEPH